MSTHRLSLLALVLAASLAGCESTTPPGKNAGTEQLRLSLTWDLKRAGVSDACIQQLSRQTLTQVHGITATSTRNSLKQLQRRQQIRTAVARDCGDQI